jgi:hypothetical protein
MGLTAIDTVVGHEAQPIAAVGVGRHTATRYTGDVFSK